MVIAMTMQNKEYWRRRYERIKEESIEQADMTAEDIETAMRKALKRIVKEINDWYARYAKDNHITLEEAKKILNARELEAFQMTLDEYIEQANDENLSDEHKKMLEQASTRVRLDRTQQLYISVVHELERLAAMENHALEQLLEEVYKDSSYKIAFETQSAQKEYKVPRKIDPHRVQIIIHRPWASDGKDFSERIWHDRDKLAKTLQVDLLQATVSGQGSEEVTQKVAKRMGVAASNARRLVHTETARIHEAAFVDTMDDANIDKLEISATLDMKTSQICQHMDGKIVATKDAKPGITIPPFHCNCRTTTIPYFDDLELEGSTRVARDPKTGKSVRVSGDLTYPEWASQYLSLSEESVLQESGRLNKRKGETEEGFSKLYEVDFNEIDKKRYHDRFTRLFPRKAQAEGLYKEARRILIEANGFNKEIGSFIDLKSGNQLSSSPGKVNSNKVKIEIPKGYKEIPNSMIAIHNHPGGDTFSRKDIQSYIRHDFIGAAVVVTNAGDIYKVSNFNRGGNIEERLDTLYNEYEKIHSSYRADLIMDNVLNDMMKEGLLVYEKEKSR